MLTSIFLIRSLLWTVSGQPCEVIAEKYNYLNFLRMVRIEFKVLLVRLGPCVNSRSYKGLSEFTEEIEGSYAFSRDD